MRKVNFIWAIPLFLILTGCGEKRRPISESDDFITVDVTKKYPEKELILQNFFDVEYTALETNDDFLCQGVVLAVGHNVILVKNQLNDGELFIFDRKGKGLRKINRKGQGSEEYISIPEITLDEDNNEIFINNFNRILIYDLFGNFKRKILHAEGYSYRSIDNFNTEFLICNNSSFDNEEETEKTPFVLISKQDGSVIRDVQIFSQQKIPTTKKINHNGFTIVGYGTNFPSTSVVWCHDSWILTVYSSDTVFRFFPDQSMAPFMVRTPSIESNNPESFLSPTVLTERCFFLQTIKMEPEVQGSTPADAILIYPQTHLMFDKQEKTIYEYTAYNDDYSNKVTVDILK